MATVIDACLEKNFEIEVVAVKLGHVIKNLKRRFFKLVGNTSQIGSFSLLLHYGPDREHATHTIDLIGASIENMSHPIGNFPCDHVCSLNLDRARNNDCGAFVMCFDSASVCSDWRSTISAFNSATASITETREYLSMIKEGMDANNVPLRPLVALRNLCTRNPSYRCAVGGSAEGAATLVALLLHRNADIQLSAISIVAACSDSSNRTQAFESAGALKSLLRCIQELAGSCDSSNAQISDAALHAIAQMCSMSTSCQDYLKEVAGLKLFLKVMSVMNSKRKDRLILKKLASSKFPAPYPNTVIKYGMIVKEGHIKKSLNNRFFELKVGQNFNPLLFISLSQEHAGRGLHKHCLDLTAAVVFFAKNTRDGYSPGCCRRLSLQPRPSNPFTKLTLCFETLEEAQEWADAIRWCQDARQILDSADEAAAAALQVPVAHDDESPARVFAAIDSLPELLPHLPNVADLTPPTSCYPGHALNCIGPAPPPPPLLPPQQTSPPSSKLHKLTGAESAGPRLNSQLQPGYVMLDISGLDLPSFAQLEKS